LLTRHVTQRRSYRRFIVWLRGIRFPAEDGAMVSAYDVVDELIHQLKLDSITKRASYMAFNFTLSLFPTIIFLFTLIPYIPVANLNAEIMAALQDAIPREMFVATQTTIADIINIPHGGLLSTGVLFALILSSNGIMALLDAFDKKYHTFRHRSYLRKRLIATALTIILSLVLLLSVAGLFFGTYIVDFLVFHELLSEQMTPTLLSLLKVLSVLLLFFATTSVIYYYVPAVDDKWPFFSAGAVVATLLIFLVSFLFTVYIRIFNSYNHFYGTIGALVGVMVWLDFVCMMLVLGFEINISIDAVTRRLERGGSLVVDATRADD
jgi:membrane protein